MIADKVLTLHNIERNLLLTALVVGTSKISLTSLSTSDINSFWDAFNDEIIFNCFFYSNLFFINNIFQSFYFGL